MAVWLMRAGSHGEFENQFVQKQRVYVTWDRLNADLGSLEERSDLGRLLSERYPDAKPKKIVNWVAQIWPFVREMAAGDTVILPLKAQRAIQVGEITGGYNYDPTGPEPFWHWRSVKWVGEAIPRENFGKDLLHSFGAFLTICRIQRNNAEERINRMRASSWDPESIASIVGNQSSALVVAETESTVDSDLEELGRDQIARLISARFRGHDFTRLVEAVLKAEGYTTYRSPEGADGGADILAGSGPLGFSAPKLCVEVKSEAGPIDRPTVDKLLGAVSKFGAEQGLFVSWGGFKSSVQKELAPSFFRVRLWTQADFLEHLFANYDHLDEDIKAELPLKRIWTVTSQDE